MSRRIRDLRQKLEFLAGPGGLAAGLRWIRKEILHQDYCDVLATRLGRKAVAVPTGLHFLRIASLGEMDLVPAPVIAQLRRISSLDVVDRVIAPGGRLYALLSGDDVACQLNIAFRQMEVISPAPLRFILAPQDAFLYDLVTPVAYRRRGLARVLIEIACADLAADGLERCICHVSLTNVPSLAAFNRAGWVPIGRTVTRWNGQFVSCRDCERAGIRIEPAQA